MQSNLLHQQTAPALSGLELQYAFRLTPPSNLLTPKMRPSSSNKPPQGNSVVTQYGVRLLPELYEVYNPMPYDAARDMEVELAISLQEKGCGVWQA